MIFKNLKLDKFQEDAVLAIEKNNSVVVSAPTGSGKTLIADYLISKEIKSGKKIIYTAPIKALSNQKFRDFVEDHGEDKIGLITGDVVINPGAQVIIMTTEVYRNMAIIDDPSLKDVSYCVMDEIHFISDEERGHVWEESIIFSSDKIRFLFLSATIPNAEEFSAWVAKIKNHKVEVILSDYRPVPLKIKFYDQELGITTLDKIREKKELDSYPQYKGIFSKRPHYRRGYVKPAESTDLAIDLHKIDKLPCIYFVFSRAKTQDYALKLAKKKDLCPSEQKKDLSSEITRMFSNLNEEVHKLKSTIKLRECLPKGIAFHHAGLLPDLKHIVEKLFGQGLIKVLFATETFALGINMPARTVCIDSLRKFTGTGFRSLNSKEFFQISGRAGRRGIDKEGLSVTIIDRRRDDLRKVKQLSSKDTMPLQSQFRLSYNTILNMVKLHSDEEIEIILRKNFYTFQELHGEIDNSAMLSPIRARYKKALKLLKSLGFIQDKKLTWKGEFATKIFSNELEITEIFFDENIKLDEYSILLIIGALAYEEKRDSKFYQTYASKDITKLEIAIRNNPFLRKGEWYSKMEDISSIMFPCYNQKKFIDLLKNTNMLEGDLIRFLLQVIDKLEQIDRALHNFDEQKRHLVKNAKTIIKNALEGMNIF